MRKFLIAITMVFAGISVSVAQASEKFPLSPYTVTPEAVKKLPDETSLTAKAESPKRIQGSNIPEDYLPKKSAKGESIERTKEEEKVREEEVNETNSSQLSPIEESFYLRTEKLGIQLKQFGYEFFKGKPEFPVSAPVDRNYILGPGDQLFIYVIGNPPGIDLSAIQSLVVDREGKVYIPGIGVFYVWGMSLGEAEKVISNAVGANIKLTVGRLRTFPVYVSGEVERPGAVVVTGINTVIDALMLAGGVKKSGSLRDVVITRKTPSGTKEIHIDFYKLLLYGKPVDIKLKDGDVIFVRPIGKVAGIGGKVKRPAIYELKGGETVEDLIEMAGGLLPSSYRYRATIQRFKNNSFLDIIDGNLSDKSFLNIKIQDGDVLVVKSIETVPRNAVRIEGYTPYPGLYEYREGMKLSEILKPDLFFPDSNMKFALITRQYPPGAIPEYITFSPEEVLSGKRDIVLKPRDRITLYKFGEVKNVDFNRVKDAFVVEGEIKYPGVYAYHDGIKLSDILSPEMLLMNTNLYYAEIDRRDPRTLDIVEIKKFVPMDILDGKTDIEIKRLDVIRFYPKYLYSPILVSGLVKKSYYVPYHDGIKLSEALASAEFVDDIKNLKVEIFRKVSSDLAEEEEKKVESSQKEGEELLKLRNKGYSIAKDEGEEEQFLKAGVLGKESRRSPDTYFKGGEQKQLRQDRGYLEFGSKEERVETEESLKKNVASIFLYDLLVKKDTECDIPLKPGDRLVISKVQPEEIVEKVYVSGYVKKPGVFRINEKTTLYDILKAAGGFRENAYPQGIIILRESVREMQKQRIAKAILLMRQELEKEEAGIMQSDLKGEELRARQAAFEAKRKLLEEIEKAQVTGRISGIIVSSNLEELKNSPYNILLEDGDRIYVPKKPGSVLVFGEVYNPTAYVYRPGMTVRDYIALAGGLTKDASEKEIFVIKADGSVVSNSSDGKLNFDWDDENNRILLDSGDILDYTLQPGDAIIVPTEIKVPTMWRPLIKDVMQIIYQGAITIYTITKL
ncbi:SLBB domain-containing protein [Phorcysia thermohydrogeniphila]|uniref:Protein involved in polysaccharide export with SLBB domain n=1 Tax=Phorcysia thermohydrogeniphila TaxID=936138 RepID=A0A4V2PDB0_9BACT|nr:SLBB domain-containing protein [Phorcysia thermohydrogeniphila]TCK04466.1 protein involved in polysaccharide export with SLBB domain [Phorcysia thermohydrogeniphila]